MKEENRLRIQKTLQTCVDQQVFPGACALVFDHGEATTFCVGKRALLPELEDNSCETIYDMASLSKVVVTMPLILRLMQEGYFLFSTPVKQILTDFPYADITIHDLLCHTSGLAADMPIHLGDNRTSIWKYICTCPRVAPRNTMVLYSDLGFIILGFVIEEVLQVSLQQAAETYILKPLGMNASGYCPPKETWDLIAPTEVSPFTQEMLRGWVHDEKASALSGVAGHAGLFSTIKDMQHVIEMLLGKGNYKGNQILTKQQVELFSKPCTPPKEIRRSIGFLCKDERSPFSRYNSASAYMHTGFTGTSMLIDPAYQVGIVLLSNRVHPTRDNIALLEERSHIHDVIMEIVLQEAKR